MPEINSVAGQLWGIPMGEVYTAGTGIKIDNVHKTVSVDETVLFNGTNTGLIDTNLSESLQNFERFRICFNPFTTNGNAKEWKEFSWGSSSDRYPVATAHYYGTEFLGWFTVFRPNSDGTKITPILNKLWIVGGTTVQDRTQIDVYKVVGINRVSGGN